MSERFSVADLHDAQKIAAIERRNPVVHSTEYQELFANDLERYWGMVTELVRAELPRSAPLSEAVAQFATAQVSEGLPNVFLKAVCAAHPQIAQRCVRFLDRLNWFLGIPSVPQDQLVPDVKKAPYLESPESMIQGTQELIQKLNDGSRGEYEAELVDQLEKAQQQGWFFQGVTQVEKHLVWRRTRFARDVKLLALGAELSREKIVFPNAEQEVSSPRLLSGIELCVFASEMEEVRELLSPTQWEKRVEIKDRVFRIEVAGKAYILKERKTPFHKHTSSDGPRYNETNTSKEEFNFAVFLNKNGKRKTPEIEISWERPIGYVTFPDGFQFSLFHAEQNLLPNPEPYTRDADEDVRRTLVAAIEKQEGFYSNEYEAVALLMKRFADDPRVLRRYSKQEGFSQALKTYVHSLTHPSKLSFTEFAEIKAQRLIDQSHTAYKQALEECKIEDRDRGRQYGLRAHVDQLPIRLETIGFDFEYLEVALPRNPKQRELTEEAQRRAYKDGYLLRSWMNPAQTAAYLTMQVLEEGIDEERMELF